MHVVIVHYPKKVLVVITNIEGPWITNVPKGKETVTSLIFSLTNNFVNSDV